LNIKNAKIDIFRITAHENEITSESAASSEPVLNLSSNGGNAATTTTNEGESGANSLKCDE
jgi:hypothetical protein